MFKQEQISITTMGKFLSISLVILSILLIQVFADEATEVKTSPKYTPLAGRVKEYEFYESFDEGWEKRWIHSKGEKYNGKWQVEQGHEPEGLTGDKGLTIPEGALHYGISTKFSKPIDNKDKDLVIQYEVRLQNGLDCGGAYMKLFPEGFEPESLLDNSRYVIMFGPDKCGSDNKVHFIFQHQNPISKEFEEKHMTTRPKIAQDKLSHLYTLHVSKDNTFVIYLDQEPIRNGSLLVDFAPPVNPSKEIDDPSDVKPADWVDEKTIPDPDAVKPEGWDDEPELIADPDATMPSDWNEEEDGVWEAPLIENPEYKGEWTAKMIENPEYKGEWKAKQIPNPNYFVDENPHNFDKLGGLGFELWTMSKDIQFDNILIAHNKEIADKLAEITWKPKFAEQRRIQKELDAKAHDAGDSFDWNKLINDITDFTSKNPIIVAVSVALGIIVPTVLCFLLPSGKPATKNAVTSNSTEEKVEEEKEEKEEVEVKETSKETSKTVNRRKPPRDNNE